MMLHLCHPAKEGHTKAYLRTVDTDVVILAIYHSYELGLAELWGGFGSSKSFKEISIHNWDLDASRHSYSSMHTQVVM